MLVNLRSPPLWPEDNIDNYIYIYIISYLSVCHVALCTLHVAIIFLYGGLKKKHSRTKKSVEAPNMNIYVTKSREVTQSHAESREIP